MDEDIVVTRSFSLRASEVGKLKEVCHRNSMNRSELIRTCILYTTLHPDIVAVMKQEVEDAGLR
jgi:hypothetical protein